MIHRHKKSRAQPEVATGFEIGFCRLVLNRAEDGLACGAKIFRRLLKTCSHALLSLLQVAAWVVGLLVTDFTVDLEYTFDVFADVCNDWTCECVLGVGVDVHLDHAVLKRFANVAELGTRTTVEHEIHLCGFTVLVSHRLLTVAKDGWLELNRTWLVGTVNVTEGCCEQEATDWLKCFVHFDHVFGVV